MISSVFIALIFLAAGFTQGVTGFGSALVAMPLLLFFLAARTATPLCVLNGLVITGYLCLRLKTHMDWRKILPLCLGCLPGIYVGVVFLKRVDDQLFRLLLGGMLIAYSVYSLLARPRSRPIHPAWAYAAGFGTGAIGAAFSAGGPPTVVYASLTGWSKEATKATFSAFFFITGLCIATAHAVTGLTTPVVLHHLAVSAGFVLAGVWLGTVCSARISRVIYLRMVLMLLVGMGFLMLGSALP